MKKLFTVLVIAALLMGTTAWAGPKTVTFAWTQVLTPPIAGWHIYQGTTPGGENLTTPLATVQFTTSQATYTYSQSVNFPDGANTTYYYKMDAYTAAGVKSVLSSEVNANLDLTVPPVPGGFTVTIQ